MVIQFLAKIRNKLKVSEKEKSSLTSENTIDFDNNNNVTRKKSNNNKEGKFTQKLLTCAS